MGVGAYQSIQKELVDCVARRSLLYTHSLTSSDDPNQDTLTCEHRRLALMTPRNVISNSIIKRYSQGRKYFGIKPGDTCSDSSLSSTTRGVGQKVPEVLVKSFCQCRSIELEIID